MCAKGGHRKHGFIKCEAEITGTRKIPEYLMVSSFADLQALPLTAVTSLPVPSLGLGPKQDEVTCLVHPSCNSNIT